MYVLGFEITLKGTQGSDEAGAANFDKREVYIDTTFPLDEQVSTLFHELIHIAFAISGLEHILKDDLDECVVRCLEYSLLPFVDRKLLLRELKKINK